MSSHREARSYVVRYSRPCEIGREDINSLLDQSIAAIQVSDFLNGDVIERLLKGLSQLDRHDYLYQGQVGDLESTRSVGVSRVGFPLSMCYDTIADGQPDLREYREQNALFAEHMEKCLQGRSTPVELVIRMLRSAWGGEVEPLRIGGVPLHTGIARYVFGDKISGTYSEPHLDWLPRFVAPLDAQFAVAIYLAVPPSGGVLELWCEETMTEELILALATQDKPIRSSLSEPAVITPAPGDLVLFNSRIPHAVSLFTGFERCSVHFFVGLDGSKRLVHWS